MASKVLGRTACPLCAYDAAHVKLKTDKAEGQAAFPYVHCRDCGTQLHTKNEHQAELLLKKTRAEKLDVPAAAPAGQPIELAPADPAPAAVPPAAAGRKMFGGLFRD
ncbi:hypothetical protein [Herbaspirillum robiniae]|uniref:hypothetical protein n=1 Tax=Herbaspirillum robiniae TaxID=2014887 RepID=UPI0009A23E06|nr:hypothetical protein [Herbaspirillum robiniae]